MACITWTPTFCFLFPLPPPPTVRGSLPCWFLAMFLVKNLVSRFYTNPFWYIGPDPTVAGQDEQGVQRQKEFADNLHVLG
ncbi:hypothetical protein BJX76DRAFT_324492 [Aspergillus varians]